jgi:mannose-6-phosphate isomerase-like protein (cupin superfamily)
MDKQKYLESGVLEQYCLGQLSKEDQADLLQMTRLYPEIKAELTTVEIAFEKLASLAAVEPGDNVKQNILTSLGFLEDNETLNINNLPVIRTSVDPKLWLDALAHLLKKETTDDVFMQVIRHDNQAQQLLVTSKSDIPEEEHGDFFEGLLILKGRCECTIGEDFYALGPGDFIEIPLHVKHNIKLVTPLVTAVLQYRFV